MQPFGHGSCLLPPRESKSGLQLVWLLLAFVLGCSALACSARTPLPDTAMQGFRPPERQHHSTSLAALDEFDVPEETMYRMGEGDDIAVDVWDHPELSGKHVLGPDGVITVPYAGALKLTGFSREDAAQTIKAALSRYYDHLVVTVRVDKYGANRVFVLGRVSTPGALLFETPPTLLEVITRAGSLPVGGLGAEKAALTRCAIFRGRDRIAWVDLQSLLNGENLALNLRLQRNDVVYIPDADDQLIYVLGRVKSPGAYHLTPAMSFLDALSRAGGPTEDAETDEIIVVRPKLNQRIRIPLGALLAATENKNVALQEGDVVYVPESGLASVGYVIRQLSPVTAFLLLGAAFGGL